MEQAASLLGTTSSTTYRYFASLTNAGLLAPSRGGRYIIGPGAIHLDWLTRNTDPLLKAAQPAMSILAGAVKIPAILILCRLYRGQVMCVADAPIHRPAFGSSYQRGRPMPLLRGAASKSILANMSDRAMQSLIKRRRDEVKQAGLGTTLAEVRASLRQIRSQGVCIASSELDIGLTGVSVPIQPSDSEPIGSLSFGIASVHAKPEMLDDLTRLLKSAAFQIDEALSSEGA